MKKYQAIVIGAGPGGLTCATKLARAGMDVLLLEKNSRIGPKICAGGITHAGLNRLVPSEIIEKSFPRQHIYSNFQKVVVAEEMPIVSTVDREKLGQWMLQRALAAGVAVRTSCPLTGIDGNSVRTRDEIIEFDYLIGADGSNSSVRRYLQLKCNKLGIGIHYRVPGNFERMEWHLNSSLFHNGYAWIFPHHNHASVGVYAGNNTLPAKKLQRGLLEWADLINLNLRHLKPKAFHINYDYQGHEFGNIFLVGDAAGLASAVTGEGILPAIVSAEAVAEKISCSGNEAHTKLKNLLRKHRKHSRIQQLTSSNKVIGALIGELLTLFLKAGIINFNSLEMGS